jgi:putative alpha-1,2-mannosidase
MGFYPVTPASDQYVIGAPLFQKVTVKLENGKQIVINAPENNAGNKYIQSAKFNGKEYSKNYLSYPELMKGATIDFKMGSQPNTKRGVNDSDFPYSFSNEKK